MVLLLLIDPDGDRIATPGIPGRQRAPHERIRAAAGGI